MDGSYHEAEENSEKEFYIRKIRELLLRNRALKSQLNVVRQDRKATRDMCQLTLQSISSAKDERHNLLSLTLSETIEQKQTQLNQFGLKLKSSKCQISKRTREMIHELWEIYPIIEFPDRKGYSICDIYLPSSEHFEGHDENMISVAIGYVSHFLLLLADFLDITLRFPVRYYGSKSLIYCNRRNQFFPLYVDSFKSREWVNFSYGMGLLNLDVVQVRTLYGLTTDEIDETLANLHGLKHSFDNDD